MDKAFRFGIMADLQYADLDDGHSHVEKITRRYRQSLSILKQARAFFDAQQTHVNILLGDLVDAKSMKGDKHDAALAAILSHLKPRERYNLVAGNHDLTCFSRPKVFSEYLPESAKSTLPTTGKVLYYSTSPHPEWRFIFLDALDVSAFNASTDSGRVLAEDLLTKMNPNLLGDKIHGNWFEGLNDDRRRFVPYNGGLGEEQMTWLRRELFDAETRGLSCIIFCHLPCYARCVDSSGLLWNAEDVLALVQSFRAVKAWFAGHDHSGGYAVCESGIHHVIPAAPLECDLGQVAFGTIAVTASEGRLEWRGKGTRTGDPWPPAVLKWR